MEALLLNILNEHHATEIFKRIYSDEAWKAFIAYHMEGFTEEEEKKRFLQIMKGHRKAFTAYRRKQNIKLKKKQKTEKRVQAEKDRQDKAATTNSSLLTTQEIVSIDDA